MRSRVDRGNPDTSYSGEARYIFNPDALDVGTFVYTGFDPDSEPNDHLDVDNFLPGTAEVSPTSTKYLLAVLPLQHLVVEGGDPHGRYEISVELAEFLKADSSEVDITSMGSSGVAVVPEPSTLGLTLAGAALVAVAVWRRRRKPNNDAVVAA